MIVDAGGSPSLRKRFLYFPSWSSSRSARAESGSGDVGCGATKAAISLIVRPSYYGIAIHATSLPMIRFFLPDMTS